MNGKRYLKGWTVFLLGFVILAAVVDVVLILQGVIIPGWAAATLVFVGAVAVRLADWTDRRWPL